MQREIGVLIGLALVYGVQHGKQASAAVLCRHKKSGVVAVREANCKQKETPLDLSEFGALGSQGPLGAQGPPGAQGPQGAEGQQGHEGLQGPQGSQGVAGAPGSPGADGQLRIYGDGSVGAVTFDTGASVIVPERSQFTDLTITSPIFVNSGAVIRCTGNFTITDTGSLTVETGVSGGFTPGAFAVQIGSATDNITFPLAPPHPAWSARPASNGEVTLSAADASGGVGGEAIGPPARWLLQPGIFGGGGGGNSNGGFGGAGGGAVVILVQGTFTNRGVIEADGGPGITSSGGGGGGIIVIASRTRIVNSGTINARGGGSPDVGGELIRMGSGGGGGGGLVHLLAPAVTQGTIDVFGGMPGMVAVGTSDVHIAGAGGGGSGGRGGAGGSVPLGNLVTPAKGGPGAPGMVLVDLVDPTALF